MPIKDVLLPLIGEPYEPTLAAIEKCVALAANLGARVTALALEDEVFVRPKVVSPDGPAAAAPAEISDMQRLLNAFNDAASRKDVRAERRSGKMPAEQIASTLAEHARFNDLTLVTVRPHDSRTELVIEKLLFESGRPLLLCPEHRAAELRANFENILIAWDNSARAARAVGDALPFLGAAASVRVLTVTDGNTETIQRSSADLIDHLKEHGVRASFEMANGSGSSTGKVIGTWAQAHEIDAIVMGAYYHSRLNEIAWGGVTKTVIGQPPCWVMMSH